MQRPSSPLVTTNKHDYTPDRLSTGHQEQGLTNTSMCLPMPAHAVVHQPPHSLAHSKHDLLWANKSYTPPPPPPTPHDAQGTWAALHCVQCHTRQVWWQWRTQKAKEVLVSLVKMMTARASAQVQSDGAPARVPGYMRAGLALHSVSCTSPQDACLLSGGRQVAKAKNTWGLAVAAM